MPELLRPLHFLLAWFGAMTNRRLALELPASVLREFVAHYNAEPNHQGIGNELIAPQWSDVVGRGRVIVRRRLGGLLNFYRRKAG